MRLLAEFSEPWLVGGGKSDGSSDGCDQPRPPHRHRCALGGLGGGHDLRPPPVPVLSVDDESKAANKSLSELVDTAAHGGAALLVVGAVVVLRGRLRSAPAAAAGSPASARAPASSASGSVRREPSRYGRGRRRAVCVQVPERVMIPRQSRVVATAAIAAISASC